MPLTRLVRTLWLAALLAAPFVLWALPADLFDTSPVVLCPSRWILGIECWTCGITRAIMHLHHFELGEALHFHTAAPLFYIGLVVLWTIWTKSAWRAVRTDKISPPAGAS